MSYCLIIIINVEKKHKNNDDVSDWWGSETQWNLSCKCYISLNVEPRLLLFTVRKYSERVEVTGLCPGEVLSCWRRFQFKLPNQCPNPPKQSIRGEICPHGPDTFSLFISLQLFNFLRWLGISLSVDASPLLHYAAGNSSLSLSSLWRASRLHVFSIRAKLSTDAAASLQFRRLFHVALKYSDCQTALGDEKGRLLAFSPTGPTSVARGSVTAPKLSQMFEPFVIGWWHFISRPHFENLTLLVARLLRPTLIFTQILMLTSRLHWCHKSSWMPHFQRLYWKRFWPRFESGWL